uniref:RRM domain-containing protein n=1 Tax=Clastoptera arizonana TaxID=38151 RepID=A0A1B6C222_9HEMI
MDAKLFLLNLSHELFGDKKISKSEQTDIMSEEINSDLKSKTDSQIDAQPNDDNKSDSDHIVIIENVCRDTKENDIVNMAQQCGEITFIKMEPEFYRTTVGFSKKPSAKSFVQTYHGVMLDLSVLKIRLKELGV